MLKQFFHLNNLKKNLQQFQNRNSKFGLMNSLKGFNRSPKQRAKI